MYNLVPRRGQLVRGEKYYDVFDVMDNLFNTNYFNQESNPVKMKTDIKQTENEYVIEAEMPGLNKKDIKLELKNNYLTISANKEDESEETIDGYLRRERRSGQVCRSFYVEGIDQTDISAKYEKGILEVTLPKKQKEEEPENIIEIK